MKATIIKSVLMLVVVAILAIAGLFWFDFLGVVQMKPFFAPVYKMLHLAPQSSKTVTAAGEAVDLDGERFAKRLKALELEKEELDKRDAALSEKEKQWSQAAAELEDRKQAQDEKEAAFEKAASQYSNRESNVEQATRNLNGMPPQNAVNILVEMDDQEVIAILRKADEIAAASNSTSLVAYWLSLMPADRAAVLQRKLANAAD